MENNSSFTHSDCSAFECYPQKDLINPCNFEYCTVESVPETNEELTSLTTSSHSDACSKLEETLHNEFEINWNQQADDVSSLTSDSEVNMGTDWNKYASWSFSDEFYQQKYDEWRGKIAKAQDIRPKDTLRSIVARSRPRDARGRLLGKNAVPENAM